jgi:membrane protease YdiL (CAAX protease family)
METPPPVPLARRVQKMPMPMSRPRAFGELMILLASVLLGPAVVYLIFRQWPAADTRWYYLFSGVGMGVGASLACLAMMRAAGHTLLTVGWTSRRLARNAGIGLLAFLVTYACLFIVILTVFMIRPEWFSGPSAAQQAIENTFPPLSLGWILLVSAFVAAWEEFVFRGFLLTHLYALFRRWWLVLPVAAGIFAMGHVYEGGLACLVITMYGLILSGLLLWRRSLTPSIVFHLTNNVVWLILLRYVVDTWK